MSHRNETQAHHLFDLKYRLGDLRGSSVEDAVLLRLGSAPVLFTAPHSVTHVRAGVSKAAEFWTGAIAESLALLTGGCALTALSPRIEADDAASPGPFVDALRMVLAARPIRLVVDVHGLSARHGVDVNLGVAGFPRVDAVEALQAELTAAFTVVVGLPYNGSRGIAGFVNRAPAVSAAAIQLELGPRFRNDTTAAADLRRLAVAVTALAEALHDHG